MEHPSLAGGIAMPYLTPPIAAAPAGRFAAAVNPLFLACIAFLGLVLLCLPAPARAEKGTLRERLTPDVMAVVCPGAERLGPEEGSPPAIAVYKGGKVAAWAFSTLDIVAAPGYSVTPFDVIAGVDPAGRITGAKVVFHREPYIYRDAVRQPLLDEFLAREAGTPLRGGAVALRPEFVAGATISARAMRAAVLDTARLVLRSRVAHTALTAPALDTEGFRLMTWNELVTEGAVARLRVTSGDVAAALARAGASGATLDVPLGQPDDLYIEVMTGLVTPAAIGGNLIGLRNFEDYRRRLVNGRQAIFVASNGPYDFLGTSHYREADGRRFDRLRLVQERNNERNNDGRKEGETIGFVHDDYQRLGTGAADGIRAQQNAGLFVLPADAAFDPLKPWRLELLVHARGATPVTVAFPVEYRLPAAHILTPDETPAAGWIEGAWAESAWVEAWRDA
jgi:NosR/NirI family nitrous oxide reductase transcriptional regulator